MAESWNRGRLTFGNIRYDFDYDVVWALDEGEIKLGCDWEITVALGETYPPFPEDIHDHLTSAIDEKTSRRFELNIGGDSSDKFVGYLYDFDIDDVSDSHFFHLTSRSDQRFMTRWK